MADEVLNGLKSLRLVGLKQTDPFKAETKLRRSLEQTSEAT